MNHDIAPLDGADHGPRVAHIGGRRGGVCRVPTRRAFVDDDNLVARGQDRPDQIRPQKPSSARDCELHDGSFILTWRRE